MGNIRRIAGRIIADAVEDDPAARDRAIRRRRVQLPKVRLEYLRGELRAERISYGEIVELQSLIKHISPGDVELLEAAGVPEFPEEE